jgi:uncharacterized protein DUF1842
MSIASVATLEPPTTTATTVPEAFLSCYKISKDLMGSPTLNTKFVVNVDGEGSGTVSGSGLLTQSVNPPVYHQFTNLRGHYTTNEGRILLVATDAIPGASLQLTMNLSSWQSGKADFRWYVNNKFNQVEGANATSVAC